MSDGMTERERNDGVTAHPRALDVPCPYCGAKISEACTNARSRSNAAPIVPHDDRMLAAVDIFGDPR